MEKVGQGWSKVTSGDQKLQEQWSRRHCNEGQGWSKVTKMVIKSCQGDDHDDIQAMDKVGQKWQKIVIKSFQSDGDSG